MGPCRSSRSSEVPGGWPTAPRGPRPRSRTILGLNPAWRPPSLRGGAAGGLPRGALSTSYEGSFFAICKADSLTVILPTPAPKSPSISLRSFFGRCMAVLARGAACGVDTRPRGTSGQPGGSTGDFDPNDVARRALRATQPADSLLFVRPRHGRGSPDERERGHPPSPSGAVRPALSGAAPEPASDQGRAPGNGLAGCLGER